MTKGKQTSVHFTDILKKIYVFLIFVFLYAPIVTLMVLSFNASKTRSKWGGFTLKWYFKLFENEAILKAFSNTMIIAFLSALFATILGTAACIGIRNMKRKHQNLIMAVTNIPMLNAEIVTGISLMLLFISLGIKTGFATVLLSHITFNIPYVILNVMPKLKQVNNSTYEAALDLGASPVYAFFKVVFPDILPGVFSGFLMAFTMSLDDFIITHFTKGAGLDTLSTKIYTEVKKGIKPEMYALSTLIFITVLILLLFINKMPDSKAKDKAQKQEDIMKKTIALACVAVAGAAALSGCGSSKNTNGEVIVYNWGEYIDPEVIELFEEETGIKVVYDEYETNETMYPKVEAGASQYDLICPSDYMIDKMIQNGLLAELNFDNIPNAKEYIGAEYYEQSKEFDPENKYSIPYCWGTVGILYNKTMVSEPITSWDVLWDPQYENNILMQDSVRDAFMVALKKNGNSMNTMDDAELNAAKDALIEQKPLVQAYVIDQVRDKMIGNEAAIGVIYSGEAIYTQRENTDLEYVIPEEGSNIWIDSWVMLKDAPNKENAEKFLDFLCRPEIALMNFEYITYSTPNTGAKELIEDESIKNSPIAFPDLSQYDNMETYSYLGEEFDENLNELWKQVKSN